MTLEKTMANPTAAMLVIGDEILSGRTRDANMNYLAQAFTKHGIDLKEARFVSDGKEEIVLAVNALRAQYDHVVTSGGIGPTHDDITADAIAEAFETKIDVRADARALLQAHYDRSGQELNVARLRMARIPDGAKLIENPVSTAPGFSIDNVHVMAGVPAVFQAMVQSLLPRLTGGDPVVSKSLRLMKGEGDVAAPLAEIAMRNPTISLGSYPFQFEGRYGTNIVARGTSETDLAAVMDELEKAFVE